MIVFLHGVPETAAVWRKVQAAIGVESVALSLPGFGCPRPDGFGCTKDEYVAWVAGRLDQFDEVDLVGHDWGAGLTYRLAMTYRLRSWVADVANIMHPDYVWHSIAQVWQTPGEGEAAMRRTLATPRETLADRYTAFGVSQEDALEMARGQDETMGGSILSLYRSAMPNPHDDWGPLTATEAPGMVLHATGDQFSDEARARDVANALGARYHPIEANHFWPYQAPDRAAEVLTSFWSSVPPGR
ncbi:alpha/beta fold hydrolase [Kibdelosporangium persicum]|uniref:Pimeloyl-ACP methyl ester carboxylesterase n=1 Tax=Kibdelosporangium persicum TaxID=2698649 RepID=A0ABX2F733_9PSEU|nr:alpha/beta hydrolase [Kibdelosporangium persicum]NRN67122.1 Pimeloyl-ACP methyl ester carboxylesterase [Kibdelosporangium persicum]